MIYVVTNKATGAEVTRYAAASVVEGAHPLEQFDHAEFPEDVEPAVAPPTRLTKLDFIDRLGDPAYIAILQMAKTHVDVEAFVKRLEMATPEPDGTSVDLTDPRTVSGITLIGAALAAAGVVGPEWTDEVLSGQ